MNRFCQGLSSVLAANDLARWKVSPVSYLPYLIGGTYDNPIDKMIKLHLDCSRRVGSKLANPYRDVDNGFHITFYEKVELLSDNESWKKGHLYEKAGDPEGKQQKFRQSAFTVSSLSLDKSEQVIRTRQMLATGEDLNKAPESEQRPNSGDVARYWTMLLLSPSGFFAEPLETPAGPGKEWEKVGRQPDKLSAEVACIVYALEKVVKRWTELNEYISGLLTENFMDPQDYDNLLFDDETFSRSRLYFWIIGCLNEFDVSIADNIKQWELFRLACVTPFIPSDANSSGDRSQKAPAFQSGQSDEIKALDKEAEDLRETLENLRSEFQNKLKTVDSLRNGVSCVPIVSFLYSTYAHGLSFGLGENDRTAPHYALLEISIFRTRFTTESGLTMCRCLAVQCQCSRRE